MYNTLKKCIKIDLINIFTSCAFILALRYLSIFDLVDSVYDTISKINLDKIQAENSAWRLPWDTLSSIQEYILTLGNNLSRLGDILVLIIGGILILLTTVIPVVIGLALMGITNNNYKLIPDLIISIFFEIYRIILAVECINIATTVVAMLLQSNVNSISLVAILIYSISICIVYVTQLIMIIIYFKNRKKNLNKVIT